MSYDHDHLPYIAKPPTVGAKKGVAMLNRPSRFPQHLLVDVIYEPVPANGGSGEDTVAKSSAEVTYDLERKQRIESIAIRYLQGRMPRLASTSSRALRRPQRLADQPGPDITYESVPVNRRHTSRLTQNNGRTVEEEHAVKRPRIEAAAKQYDQGRMPVIQSASLRGSFEKNWKNPWVKRLAGRGSNTHVTRPRPVQEFDHIVVTPKTRASRSEGLNAISTKCRPTIEQQHPHADMITEASKITVISQSSSKLTGVNSDISLTRTRLEVQGTAEPVLSKANGVHTEESGATVDLPQQALPLLVAEERSHSPELQNASRRILPGPKGKKDSKSPHDDESPFPFKYQKYIAKEKKAEELNSSEGAQVDDFDSSGKKKKKKKKKMPRRMEFNSSQDIVGTNKPKGEMRLKMYSIPPTELRDLIIARFTSGIAVQSGSTITNAVLTGDGSKAALATGVIATVDEVSSTTIVATGEGDNAVSVSHPASEKETAVSVEKQKKKKKRKRQAAIEIDGASPQAVDGPETHPRRLKRNPARFSSPIHPSTPIGYAPDALATIESTITIADREDADHQLSGRNDAQTVADQEHMDQPMDEAMDEPLGEQESALDPTIVREPATRSSRKNARPQPIAPEATPKVLPNERITGNDTLDSTTLQGINGDSMAIESPTLVLPDASNLKKSKKTKKGIARSSTDVAPPQPKSSELPRLSSQHTDEMLDHVVVEPRTMRPQVKIDVPETRGTVSPPDQGTNDTETYVTPPRVEKPQAVVNAQQDDEHPSSYVPVMQDKPGRRPRKRTSRPGGLDSTETPDTLSRKNKSKGQITGRMSDHLTNGNTQAGAQTGDRNLPPDEQQILDSPKTPKHMKRVLTVSRHSTDVTRTRSQRTNGKTLKHTLSPEDRRDFSGVVDSYLSVDHVLSEDDANIAEAPGYNGSSIILFSAFKKGVARRAIEDALATKQPMSTQQLFEAQSPIVFSTEKKCKTQERFEPDSNSEAEYQDTQALFDAAGGLYTPTGSDMDDEDQVYTPVQPRSRRRSSGRRQEVSHSSLQSRSSRQIVGIDRLPLQENMSLSSMNQMSSSLRKSSRLGGRKGASEQQSQQLSHPSQSDLDVDFSFVDSLLELRPSARHVR